MINNDYIVARSLSITDNTDRENIPMSITLHKYKLVLSLQKLYFWCANLITGPYNIQHIFLHVN